jgi:two-component system sensor histidine kinase KdpD
MPLKKHRRPSPEQLLKQVEAAERHEVRGKLKIFLGYASGVGKSFRMLDEGRRRKMRGEDVVVAATQANAVPEAEELLQYFEVIPLRTDLGAPAIDIPAVLRRRPQVCLIDGLAYQNPPRSKNQERWQDVDELLAAGISVITSINLQHVRERQPRVEAIRGRSTKESVPEAFLHKADEIEIVDAPPEYCVTRAVQSGSTSLPDTQKQERQLSELREIALVLAAEVVDHQLEEYLRRQGIEQVYGAHERILVCITPRSNASVMIHRGRRQADRFHGVLHVAYVQQDNLSPKDQRTLFDNLARAREANAHVEILQGEDPIALIVEYATKNGITQIFVGHSQETRWTDYWKPDPVERLIVEAEGIDIRIFPQEESRK